MTANLDQAKQPVSRALAGPYGHPFHPILVTVPIGAWVCSLVFDIGSHMVASPGHLTLGSTWLIGIGVIGAAAAAMIGLLDFIAIPTGTRAFRVGLIHMMLNLAVTVGYIVNFEWRRIDHYTDQAAVGWGPLVLSVVLLAALGASGYLGGMLAYRYGVRVASESLQASGYQKRNTTE